MEEEIVSARGLTWGLPGQGAVIITASIFQLVGYSPLCRTAHLQEPI